MLKDFFLLKQLREWKIRYKNSKFSSRLFSWLIILSVAGALSYNFRWDYATILISTASLLAAIEVLVFRPYFLSAAVITLAFGFSFIMYMYYFLQALIYYYTENQLAYVEASMYGGAVLATVLTLTSCWYLANGRFWFNLLISYILYLLTLIFLPMLPLNPIYMPLIALIPVLGWVAVRRFWLYRRDYKADISLLPTSESETAFEKNMTKVFPEAHIMNEDRVVTVYNKKNILLLLPITPESSLELTHKGILMDGEDITFVMAHLTKKLSIISKAAKISGRKFFPVVYVSNNKMKKGVTPVSYRSRQKPDIMEGTVFFTNKKDFSRFLNELIVNAPKLSEKEQARYEKLFMSSQKAELSK